jgi:ribose transport system permease protein
MIMMKILKWNLLPVFGLMIVFLILNIFITPGFLSLSSLSGFISSYAPLICVSIGSAVVMFGGGIDISLGAIVSLVNVILITLIGKGWGIGEAIGAALGVAILVGILNGSVIGFLRVNPLLATFSTSSVAAGLALWIMPAPGGQAPMDFIQLYNGFLFSIPTPVYFILITFALWIFIKMTPAGIWLFASGRDERKAYVSAIPVQWIQFFTYVFAAFVSGIGAIALTGSVGSGDPLVGLPLSLNAIAACVIGGISLMGGSGEVMGAIFGAIFLGLVTTTVLAAQISPFYQDLLSGAIVLIGILGATWIRRKRTGLAY